MNSEKIRILKKIKASLLDMLDRTRNSAAAAQEEANYHIGAMQSRYDTFKEEAQYLVAAQQVRQAELERQVGQCNFLLNKLDHNEIKFSFVELGAAFTVVIGVKRCAFFIVPGGGGSAECINGISFLCVSYEAPIIKRYIGLSEGEEAESDGDECYVESIF